MTDDRVVDFPTNPASGPQGLEGEDGHESEAGRVTMGVEVPADRRLVLTVQTIAQLVTIAKEEGMPLDDGLVQGVEKLAHRLRGAGLALPAHLEDALSEIGFSLTPPEQYDNEAHESSGQVLPFPGKGRAPD